jgi:CheY-like chemotaxis protein
LGLNGKNIMGKILVIDDSEVNNLLIHSLFEDNSIEIISETNSKKSLERALSEQPDLILLDLMMPGMDGFSVLKGLKENEKTQTIPVLVVSAKQENYDINQALDMGAEDYIKKPIGINMLYEKVMNYIK